MVIATSSVTDRALNGHFLVLAKMVSAIAPRAEHRHARMVNWLILAVPLNVVDYLLRRPTPGGNPGKLWLESNPDEVEIRVRRIVACGVAVLKLDAKLVSEFLEANLSTIAVVHCHLLEIDDFDKCCNL